MENASKALLLAAAILIAIILISLGVYIVSQGSDVVGQGGQALDEVSIQQFNGKFDIYEGTKTGTQVKQLIKTVSASNTSNPGQQVHLAGDTSLWEETTSNDGTVSYKAKNTIGNSKKYNITTTPGASGVIETITITTPPTNP